MKFIYDKKGFEIVFDDTEKKIVNEIGKIYLDYENAKHFVNHLSHVVTETHKQCFNSQSEDIKNQMTFEKTEVKTK